MAKKANKVVPIMLRMPDELRKRLEREIKTSKRSLNGEMVLRLEQSFAREDAALQEGAFLDLLAAAAPKTVNAEGQEEIDILALTKRFADVLRPRLAPSSDSHLSRYLADHIPPPTTRRFRAADIKTDPKPITEKDE
jgi:hypothetical protein